MAREVSIDRASMLDAVMNIIERDGFSAVSARTVAGELGVSTQPIYREFGDMDGLRLAAIGRGFEIFSHYLEGEAIDQAVKYVMFATEHGKLFDFLFRGKHYTYDGLDGLSHSLIEDTRIIDKLQEITGLPREKVFRLHLCVWMALHGLATLAADNTTKLDAGEISTLTHEMTRALTMYYKENG